MPITLSIRSFPKGLDFLVSIYTRFPYYKDKIGISRWEYNALDAVATYAVAMEIEKELKRLWYPLILSRFYKQTNHTIHGGSK